MKDLPENSAACVEVVGEAAAFPAILTAYDSAASGTTDHGFAFAGPVRMVHRRWAGAVGHPDNRVEIVWPFEERSVEA
ncbi:hypothetical protein ACIQCR_33280 [Streptomyces sp. NPDC093249]|uniref:hypothetical protein n=1 Tax=unclassified Streptomyces TaxID=2593676 RepID=UPI0038003A97